MSCITLLQVQKIGFVVMFKNKKLSSLVAIIITCSLTALPSFNHRSHESSNYHSEDPLFERETRPIGKDTAELCSELFEVTDEQKKEAKKKLQKYIDEKHNDAQSLEKIAEKLQNEFDSSNPKDGLDKNEVTKIVETVDINTWFPGCWAEEIIKITDTEEPKDKKISTKELEKFLGDIGITPPPPPTPTPTPTI